MSLKGYKYYSKSIKKCQLVVLSKDKILMAFLNYYKP